mgnify:CR=1 FL=1
MSGRSFRRDSSGFSMDDYVDVAARLAEFRAKYPEGSLQPANLAEPFKILTIGQDTYIVVVAAAYRHPDDPRPGIGMAYEPYPGKTPYTRGSELQNAETSAWGRAIVAALAADTRRGIASAEEVRNRRAEQATRSEQVVRPTRHQTEEYNGLARLITDASDVETLRELWAAVGESVREGRITSAQAEELRAAVKQQRAKAAQQEQQGQVQEPAAEVAAA